MKTAVIGAEILLGTGTFLMLAMLKAGIAEREHRASRLAAAGAALLAGVGSFLWIFRFTAPAAAAAWLIFVSGMVFIVVSLIPWMPQPDDIDPEGMLRYDERNHMFSRANLCCFPGLRKAHHRKHPEHRMFDLGLDSLPALGEAGGRYHDPVLSPASIAAFSILDRSFAPLSNAPPPRGPGLEGMELLKSLQNLAARYGAVDLGVTRTRDYHWYSHAGRQATEWGRPITPDSPTAIVIVVAMDFASIRKAPRADVLAESSHQYVEAAKIAHILAEYLRLQGWKARAHVDGHYQVLCVPMAQDAGLGRVGRMGILIHPVFGPCIRLSVVTTDAELPTGSPGYGDMESFCEICRKCARSCPSRAISPGEAGVSRGFPHWSVDQEKCYGFWRKMGTDCSVCIATCPYTKPDSLIHRIIRAYIRRNRLNQRLALLGDDLFYGRRFKIKNPVSRRPAICLSHRRSPWRR